MSMTLSRRGLFRAFSEQSASAPDAPLKALIGQSCLEYQGVSCRRCGEECGERAIVFRPQRGGLYHPIIEAARCTGCGACLPVCPSHAVSLQPKEAQI